MNCRLPQAKLYHIWRELWRHTRRQSSPLLEASSSRIFTGQKEACSTQTSTQTLPKAISLPKPKSSYPIPSKPRNPQILHPATARPARSVTPHTRRRDHHGIKIQCTWAYPSSCLDIHPPLLSEFSFRIARQRNLRTSLTPQLTLNLIRASRHSVCAGLTLL